MNDRAPAWGDFSVSTDPPTLYGTPNKILAHELGGRAGSDSNSDTLEFATVALHLV
jgi:hypothetical protein